MEQTFVRQRLCRPNYIQKALKRKYGQNIRVLGALGDDIHRFWKQVSYHALTSTVPTEVGRAIVSIDTKCHANVPDGKQEEKGGEKLDEFEILNEVNSKEPCAKVYQLNIGIGKLGILVEGTEFFNMANKGDENASLQATSTMQVPQTSTMEKEAVSQGYKIIDCVKVAPNTKVKAKINTWAVTYEAKVCTLVSVDANASIPVHFETSFASMLHDFSCKLCQVVCLSYGVLTWTVGTITAEDIFVDEEDFRSDNGTVAFKRDGKISYIGEEVEIFKQKTNP